MQQKNFTFLGKEFTAKAYSGIVVSVRKYFEPSRYQQPLPKQEIWMQHEGKEEEFSFTGNIPIRESHSMTVTKLHIGNSIYTNSVCNNTTGERYELTRIPQICASYGFPQETYLGWLSLILLVAAGYLYFFLDKPLIPDLNDNTLLAGLAVLACLACRFYKKRIRNNFISHCKANEQEVREAERSSLGTQGQESPR